MEWYSEILRRVADDMENGNRPTASDMAGLASLISEWIEQLKGGK